MEMVRLGRNDLCRCRSGKKFKKCCLSFNPSPPAEIYLLPWDRWPIPLLLSDLQLEAFKHKDVVFVKGKGWTHERDLNPGDQYRLKGGGWETVPENQVIRTTEEHPFFVQGKGWTPLREINPGDLIRTEDGWVPVAKVENTGQWETVYNIRVADHHTYFVGKPEWGFSVWAHNIYFQHLDRADESHANLGKTYVLLSQQAFASIPRVYQNATVAVSEANVDGVKRYVFAVYGPQGAFEAVEAFAQSVSGVVYHAGGGIHAEEYIHRHFAGSTGFTGVIGHSNYNGTCPPCRAYFASVGFANVWWSKDKSL